MDAGVHLVRPFKEAPKVGALGPKKFPKFEEADLGHFDAGVGFHAPKKIRAAPGREAVSSRGVPEEAQHLPHRIQYSVGQGTLRAWLGGRWPLNQARSWSGG